MAQEPPPLTGSATAKPAVTARLVTSAPEGLLRLEFTTPPGAAWTLVRAELARRLAEVAVSQAAAVSETDLATFARGRGLPVRPQVAEAAPVAASPVSAEPTAPVARSGAPAPPDGTPAQALGLPEMLTGEALAPRLGLSRATVALRRQAGRLLALESGTKRGFRYPAWQIRHLLNPVTRGSFEEALQALAPRGPWAAYRFFTEPCGAGGPTPLALLDAGDLPAFRTALRGRLR